MYGYIYKTTDKVTNKIYIGKKTSTNFKGIDYIGSGLIVSRIKQQCINDNISLSDRFNVELIDIADSKIQLDQKEIYYIDFYDSRNPEIGYNLRKGGDCGPGGPMFKGHKHSINTRLKMSESRRGINNSNYGNHWKCSDELKQLHSKLSSGECNGMYGKKHTEDSKLKNSQAHLGKIAVSNYNLDIVKMINPSELTLYLDSGWVKGNIHRIK